MGRRSEPFLVAIRNFFRVVVFRVFLFQFILLITLIISPYCVLRLAQDASTGALRGVLDAQGAVITNADIVAISVETGVRYHGLPIRRDNLWSICCRRGIIRRAPRRKECRRRFLQ